MMEEQQSDKPSLRFLSFANDKEDIEKEAKLKAAAAKIEQAIAKEKALNELVDFRAPNNQEETIDPALDVRSLYDRLQEQRNKKQEAIDEAKKLSNFIPHLDEDDADYLNEVAKNRREKELRKRLEIHDALEAKKRLDEQKMLDDEERRRKSLLGQTTRDGKTPRSRISSMIKVKPKTNSRGNSETKSDKDDSSGCSDLTRSSSSKRPNEEGEPDKTSVQKKRSSLDKVDKQGNLINQYDDVQQKSNLNYGTHTCECPKDVAKVLGVLPSSSIVSHDPKDSEDSDYSDDDLNCRLIPRGRKKRR